MDQSLRFALTSALQCDIRTLALHTRSRLALTQHQMAERLVMSDRSYSDIETGRSGCSSLTLIRLLALQENPAVLIKSIDSRLEQIYLQADF